MNVHIKMEMGMTKTKNIWLILISLLTLAIFLISFMKQSSNSISTNEAMPAASDKNTIMTKKRLDSLEKNFSLVALQQQKIMNIYNNKLKFHYRELN